MDQECNGKQPNTNIISAVLLIFQVKLNFEDTNSSLDEMQPMVTVMGEKYLIAVMILSNGSHFQSIVLIGGKYLHYDGMKNTPLKWLDHQTKISATVYKVSKLWYTQEKSSDVELSQENENKTIK